MQLAEQLNLMAASSAKPAVNIPITKHFQASGKGLKCSLCGAAVKDHLEAAKHLFATHKELNARDFSQGRRKKLAKSGAAMPDGSFPITNKEDLKNAKFLVGHSKHPSAARAHIRERAKALGVKSTVNADQFSPGDRLSRKPQPGQSNPAEYMPGRIQGGRQRPVKTYANPRKLVANGMRGSQIV